MRDSVPGKGGVYGHEKRTQRLLLEVFNHCFLPKGPTRVQKMHWHWAMVVICSTGYSPRHSLHDTRGSRARSHVGRYRAVVMAEQSEMREAWAVRSPCANSPAEPRRGSLPAAARSLGRGPRF